jgi:hypothetical protein
MSRAEIPEVSTSIDAANVPGVVTSDAPAGGSVSITSTAARKQSPSDGPAGGNTLAPRLQKPHPSDAAADDRIPIPTPFQLEQSADQLSTLKSVGYSRPSPRASTHKKIDDESFHSIESPADSPDLGKQADEHSLHSQEDPPKTTLDKIILVIVVIGIIAFAVFQIQQCVVAYTEPIPSSSLETVKRTFPGVMICPYSSKENGGDADPIACSSEQLNSDSFDNCPLWAPTASLSFDWVGQVPTFSETFCSDNAAPTMSLFNTNVDPGSSRSVSKCLNLASSVTGGNSPLVFGLMNNAGCIKSFARQILLKNSASSLNCTSVGCRSCQNFNPPNVKCLVYDPSFFDDAIKKIPGLESVCNPFRETSPNSQDAIEILDPQEFGLQNERIGLGYEYSGLIPKRCSRAPSNLKLSTYDLRSQGQNQALYALQYYQNLNMSLFGGLVAVFYDSSKGVPKELNFDDIFAFSSNGKLLSDKPDHVLGSKTLLYTKCVKGPGGKCDQIKQPELSVQAAFRIDTKYTNAALGRTDTTMTSSVSIQPAISRPGNYRYPLSISFSSPFTVVAKSVISLSILTTLSIIVSTAGTLWSSQTTIKETFILVTTKIQEFLARRRAKVNIN